jgi:hypothetical protein
MLAIHTPAVSQPALSTAQVPFAGRPVWSLVACRRGPTRTVRDSGGLTRVNGLGPVTIPRTPGDTPERVSSLTGYGYYAGNPRNSHGRRNSTAGSGAKTEWSCSSCRLGGRTFRLLGLRWCDFDEEAATITVQGKVIRVSGKGLVRVDQTKTDAGRRTISLPKFAVAALTERRGRPFWGERNVIFPSSAGTLKDPDNFNRQWRTVRDQLGVPDITSHSFRKTVATLIDDGGLSARVGADHLGHANISMTQDRYISRGQLHNQVADLLDRAARHHSVPPAGFEPATTRLEVMCSVQLSYGGWITSLQFLSAGQCIQRHGTPIHGAQRRSKCRWPRQ